MKKGPKNSISTSYYNFLLRCTVCSFLYLYSTGALVHRCSLASPPSLPEQIVIMYFGPPRKNAPPVTRHKGRRNNTLTADKTGRPCRTTQSERNIAQKNEPEITPRKINGITYHGRRTSRGTIERTPESHREIAQKRDLRSAEKRSLSKESVRPPSLGSSTSGRFKGSISDADRDRYEPILEGRMRKLQAPDESTHRTPPRSPVALSSPNFASPPEGSLAAGTLSPRAPSPLSPVASQLCQPISGSERTKHSEPNDVSMDIYTIDEGLEDHCERRINHRHCAMQVLQVPEGLQPEEGCWDVEDYLDQLVEDQCGADDDMQTALYYRIFAWAAFKLDR